ncbi:MAG: hypothetical protein ACOC8K_01850 [Gemmatimonadota bacterium]
MEVLKEAATPSAEAIDCPRCGAPLERREVPPRSDVSYVRERIWLLCASCGRSGVLDRPGRMRGG